MGAECRFNRESETRKPALDGLYIAVSSGDRLGSTGNWLSDQLFIGGIFVRVGARFGAGGFDAAVSEVGICGHSVLFL